MDRKYNAPNGILTFMEYKGYEQNTYDWEIVYEDGYFAMWEYFDGVEWHHKYCACYKGKAFNCGDVLGNVRTAYDTAIEFLGFMELVDRVDGNGI